MGKIIATRPAFEYVKLIWRWNTGFAMDGIHHTDAGWFTRGVHAYHRTGKVYSWHYVPRFWRMLTRWAINTYVLCVLAALYPLVRYHTFEGFYIDAGILVLTLGWFTAYGIRKFRTYWLNSHTLTPLASALGERLGVAPQEAEKKITLVHDWSKVKDGKVGRIHLPAHFGGTPPEETLVEQVVCSKLGKTLVFDWHVAGGKGGYVDFKAVPPIPAKVNFWDHFTAIIVEMKPLSYFMGAVSGGTLRQYSMEGEYAHHGLSFNSGRGKSTTLTMVIAQLYVAELRCRALLPHFTIIDTKYVSLDILRGLPGIEIYSDPAKIEDMVKASQNVQTVMNQRYQDQKQDPTLAGSWPLEMLIMEEGNDFSVQLDAWYDANKPKGGKPKCPWWRDTFARILWQGRQVNVHVYGVYQYMLEKYLGNMNLRPAFGWIFLSGYKPQQYKSVTGNTSGPKAQPGKGRMLANDGGENEEWLQGLYDPSEGVKLREWMEHEYARFMGQTQEEYQNVLV